jgi:hypothetical protein
MIEGDNDRNLTFRLCDDFQVQDVENFTITNVKQYGGVYTTDPVVDNIVQWNVEVSTVTNVNERFTGNPFGQGLLILTLMVVL